MKNHPSKTIKLTDFEIEIKKQKLHELLFGPEQEILKKQSDIFLDGLFLEIQLRDGKSKIADVIQIEPREYEPIFHKVWFYRLADMLGVSRKVMDTYVKPGYVRDFFIKFVYARLGYMILRELKAARRIAKANGAKLFQFLKGDYYQIIHRIAAEIYTEMEGKNEDQFILAYSTKFGLPIQKKLF